MIMKYVFFYVYVTTMSIRLYDSHSNGGGFCISRIRYAFYVPDELFSFSSLYINIIPEFQGKNQFCDAFINLDN